MQEGSGAPFGLAKLRKEVTKMEEKRAGELQTRAYVLLAEDRLMAGEKDEAFWALEQAHGYRKLFGTDEGTEAGFIALHERSFV